MPHEFIPLKLGANWLGELWRKVQDIRSTRQKEINKLGEVLLVDPLELAQYYVEPFYQETNPADRLEEISVESKMIYSRQPEKVGKPIFRMIDVFLSQKPPGPPGNNVLFVLGDTGMGKTSLLAIIGLLHLTSFWPNEKRCVIKKLGPNTIPEIKQLENTSKTILLLDSLDEDPLAYGQIRDRLINILEATEHFYRIFITCRTQFFPTIGADPFHREGFITVGGYICKAVYLSFFDNSQVEIFLKKRFPNRFRIFAPKIRKQARLVIERMDTFSCRPLLLAYIDALVESTSSYSKGSQFAIYEALLLSWLLREEKKTKISHKELFHACEILATELTLKRKRTISERDLNLLIARTPEISAIKSIDIKGRSLLNKNSDGHYRFAHLSIQEFLLAFRILYDRTWKAEAPIPATDLILHFLIDARPTENLRLAFLDLKSIKLSDLTLTGADLSGADLSHIDLSGSNLNKVNLTGANLTSANLLQASLIGATLTGANLTGANLSLVNLKASILIGTNLSNAWLSGADLSGADLTDAEMSGATLTGANLTNAILPDLSKTYFGEISDPSQ